MLITVKHYTSYGSRVTMTLETSGIIALSCADFKKALKEVVSDFDDERRENNLSIIENELTANKKMYAVNLKAFREMTGKKEKDTPETKIIRDILKSAKKHVINDRMHNAFFKNGFYYACDGFISVRSKKAFTGIEINPDNLPENAFPDFNGIYTGAETNTVYTLPDIERVKAYSKMKKNELNYYALDNFSAFNCALLLQAMTLTGSRDISANNKKRFSPACMTGNGYEIIIMPLRPEKEDVSPRTFYALKNNVITGTETIENAEKIENAETEKETVKPYKVTVYAYGENETVLFNASAETENEIISVYNAHAGKLEKNRSYYVVFENNGDLIAARLLSETRGAVSAMEYITRHVISPETLPETIKSYDLETVKSISALSADSEKSPDQHVSAGIPDRDQNGVKTGIIDTVINFPGALKTFNAVMSDIYNTLSDNPDIEKACHDYIYIAAWYMKEYPALHTALIKVRNDVIASYRECIAYALTLDFYAIVRAAYLPDNNLNLPDYKALVKQKEKKRKKALSVTSHKLTKQEKEYLTNAIKERLNMINYGMLGRGYNIKIYPMRTELEMKDYRIDKDFRYVLKDGKPIYKLNRKWNRNGIETLPTWIPATSEDVMRYVS